ncbi:MAG: hypothetical protein RI897_3951 [Verrucomicrobiota bacterium]
MPEDMAEFWMAALVSAMSSGVLGGEGLSWISLRSFSRRRRRFS